MPRSKRWPTIPFASVGDTVTASNGKQYTIVRVDGAKAWMKPAKRPGNELGAGNHRLGLMVGNPAQTHVPKSGESEMAGAVSRPATLEVTIL